MLRFPSPRSIALAAVVTLLSAGCAAPPGYRGDRISFLPWSIPHGTGTMVNKDGSVYRGEWYEGKKHGPGTVTYPDGTTYTGTWVEGLRHGKGRYTVPSGASFEVLYRRGELVGLIE
jgi:hypothetical protein